MFLFSRCNKACMNYVRILRVHRHPTIPPLPQNVDHIDVIGDRIPNRSLVPGPHLPSILGNFNPFRLLRGGNNPTNSSDHEVTKKDELLYIQNMSTMITAAKHVASRPTGQYQDIPPPNEHADPTVVNKYGSAIEQWSFEVLGHMSGHRLRCPHVCPCGTRCTSRTTLGMHLCNLCKFVHNALPREITKPGADEPATSMRGDFNARHMDGQQKTYECLCWVQDPPLVMDDYGVVFPECARRPDGTKLGDQFTMIAQMGHTTFGERDAEFGIQMQFGETEADHFIVRRIYRTWHRRTW